MKNQMIATLAELLERMAEKTKTADLDGPHDTDLFIAEIKKDLSAVEIQIMAIQALKRSEQIIA